MNEYSRTHIKRRMMETAATHWGLKPQEMRQIDPVVEMLFGAFSTEIQKVYGEIKESRGRILNHLSKELLPTALTGPFPSSTLLTARAKEEQTEVDPTSKWVFRDQHRGELKDLHFMPSGSFKIWDAAIAAIAYEDQIFNWEEISLRKEIARSPNRQRLNAATLWIALETPKKKISLKDLRFCFSWEQMNHALNENDLYPWLEGSQWRVNGEVLNIKPGFTPVVPLEVEQDHLFKDIFQLIGLIKNEVNVFYDKHFVTIEDDIVVEAKTPEELTRVFGEELLQLPEDLIWFEVRVAEAFPREALAETVCCLNAFPVINAKSQGFSFQLSQHLNIIPVDTGKENFLGLEGITGSKGKYFATPLEKITSPTPPEGSYCLRNGGVGRFEALDARNLLDDLFEKVRDESAAFSALGYNLLEADLHELNQVINRIEKRVKESGTEKQEIPYLIVTPEMADDLVYVSYYSTAGEVANGIPGGVVIEARSNPNVQPDNIFTIRDSSGGRDASGDKAQREHLRHTLLSRNRIVSKADLMTFVQARFEGQCKSIEVERAVFVDKSIHLGLVKGWKVTLTPADSIKEFTQWFFQLKKAETEIENKSIPGLYVRLESSVQPTTQNE